MAGGDEGEAGVLCELGLDGGKDVVHDGVPAGIDSQQVMYRAYGGFLRFLEALVHGGAN
jgi:hypothetical protein